MEINGHAGIAAQEVSKIMNELVTDQPDEQPNNTEPKEKKSRFGWVKSGISSIGSKANDLKKYAEDSYENIDTRYKPESLFSTIKPYVEKAVLMVAIAAASETLSDEEKMESIYFWILKLVPSPVRIFMPEKLIFKALWSFRSDLIAKVDIYQEKINNSANKEDEITKLEIQADASISKAELLPLHSETAVIVPTSAPTT